MRYILFALITALTGSALYMGLTAGVIAPKARVFETSAGQVAVAKIAGPLDHPWAVAFLPDRSMLVTERGGRLLHITPEGELSTISGVPNVRAKGQGGLLDVVIARDFDQSGEIFLTYAAPKGDHGTTALAIAKFDQTRRALSDLRVIFRQKPASTSSRHFGGRIVEAPDGTLWLTLGDRGSQLHVQSPVNYLGKIVRINRDGTSPGDNPFAAGMMPREVWSTGHRNPQGAALDPETGALWTVEHGAKGGDEINKPQPGRNYGWPIISYGRHYDGSQIGEGVEQPGLEQPVHYWDPSIAPSGLMIYSGRLWPDWTGDLFVGALKSQLISRLDRDGDRITEEEQLFAEVYGRVRDIREGPGGGIWFLTDHDDGGLFRMLPAE